MGRTELYATRCKLDTTTVILPARAGQLKQTVLDYPEAELVPEGSSPDGAHPIWFELSVVYDGQPDFNGLRELSRVTGESPLGFWWQAMTPWITATTATLSSAIGAYHEIMLGIPNVRLQGRAEGPFMLVLGMYTDAQLAKWGDDALRYGYGKQLARIVRAAYDQFTVYDHRGELLLRSIPSERAVSSPELDERLTPSRAARWWRQPLLGYVGNGEYAVSRLTRSMGEESIVHAPPASFALELSVPFGLPAGRYSVARTKGAYGVCRVSGMDARLTYPSHIRL